LSVSQYDELIEYNLELKKDIYSQNDVKRFLAFSYFYSLGFTAKNFTIFKSMSDRGAGFNIRRFIALFTLFFLLQNSLISATELDDNDLTTEYYLSYDLNNESIMLILMI